MATSLQGKSIVITGGTSGIGKACALAFSAAGWQVAICGRRAELLAEVKAASQERMKREG